MKLPAHLNALRAFEASARHQSFSAAANELNVTPAAVGQLVRGLEDWLGAPLFHRNTTGKARLVVTDQAKQALPIIHEGLEKLSLGLKTLKDGSRSGILTVTVSPAFAAKWLLPRIEHFQALNPETDVRLDMSLKPIDFVKNNIDVGVRYGAGEWAGLVSEKLMDEEIYPVCSPSYLSNHPELTADPLSLINQTLIHDLSIGEKLEFVNWTKWFNKLGLSLSSGNRGMQINNSAAVLQTAIDGHGVALARSVMAREDIVSGRLIRLYPEITYISELAYYVVYRPEWSSLPRMVAFRNWLVEESSRQTQ
ncbi:transcriptional regulator GcvA [Methylophilus sp. 13]|uniref:transcriptional regulator GcvA n=1 Tax=Methylophilus sp. 13 TaxID=2781018 RepID=UPI0018903ACB|nr:transcriptional regulator GcvA [Methylophilus sp. 13]MBF5037887.1 transcriptional regulator GcvA [Methylophilus sp. 13]